MKKGYIFTLDAFIAILILIVGIVLIISFIIYAPEKDRTDALTTDVMGVLANVKINDICPACNCPNYPKTQDACILMGGASNENQTLLEMFGELYSIDCGDPQGRKAINETVHELFIENNLLPNNYQLEIRLTDVATGEVEQLYPLVP